MFFFLAHGCHAALDAPKKVCPDAVDSCTKTAWENGGLRGMPRLPVFLSKHKVPLGFVLDAKHPEANLQMLCDFVEEEGVSLGTLFLPQSMGLSAEGGRALGPRVLGLLRPQWHEEQLQRFAARIVVALLCRLAGGPAKPKEALRSGPAGIQIVRDLSGHAHRRRAMDSVSSLAGATWLIE